MGCRKSIASQEMGLTLRTVERWEKRPHIPDRREGPNTAPAHKLSEVECNKILEIINSKKYGALSPCQIVPKLADEGIYIASESSYYRVLRRNNLLHHRGKAKQRVPYRKPASCAATAPNQVWSWGITFMNAEIKGKFYYLYLFMDIYSRKIVAHQVYEEQSAENASNLAKKAYRDEKINGKKIKLHSDNGGPMKGSTMLVTLQKLGVVPSFSRPSVSNDNPFSESLFRTLKYCPEYPSKNFESLIHANQWVSNFVAWYNNSHLHSGIKFLTPQSRHNGEDQMIILKRQQTYELAKKINPARWSKNTRNWLPNNEVLLNPNTLDARAA